MKLQRSPVSLLRPGQCIVFDGDSLTSRRMRPSLDTWPYLRLMNWERTYADRVAEWLFCNRPDLRLMEAATATSAEASESVTITLRIDPRMLARIKRLARSRYLNYQSMIKQWLSERLERELH